MDSTNRAGAVRHVDPGRDTLAVLNAYAQAFSPQIEGLRGTDNQLADLARRYRVAYSVDPKAALRR